MYVVGVIVNRKQCPAFPPKECRVVKCKYIYSKSKPTTGHWIVTATRERNEARMCMVLGGWGSSRYGARQRKQTELLVGKAVEVSGTIYGLQSQKAKSSSTARDGTISRRQQH